MKKIFIYILIFFILLVLALFLFPYEIKQDKEIVAFELTNNAKNIHLYNQESDLVFNYSLDDFKDWAKNNWTDIFSETPSFGDIREVEIDNFNNFSSLSMSNDEKYLAFVVSDYAVLTDISFIAFINLKTYEISLIKEEIFGSVNNIKWSSDNNYIAYLLDTARTQGDYLRIDYVLTKEKLISINKEDVNSDDLIIFSNLVWLDNNSLQFFTDLGDRWQFNINDNSLKLIN